MLVSLQDLYPRTITNVIDLLAQAEIDVTPWSWKKDGTPSAKVADNPNYCYRWAFGGSGEPTALCIWHAHLTLLEENVVFVGNLRNIALQLRQAAIDFADDEKIPNRAMGQARRAAEFDRFVSAAYSFQNPIRVLLIDGPTHGYAAIGTEKSEVTKRVLDSFEWFVHDYDDETGDFKIVRGLIPLGPPEFVDQFSNFDKPETKFALKAIRYRNPTVRLSVMRRAKGHCELCGERGFDTLKGPPYLETHHVHFLCDDGPDTEKNVVALCANCHMQAHHGLNQLEITMQLQKYLAQC